MTIPGIGEITALTRALEIGEVQRVGRYCEYLRIFRIMNFKNELRANKTYREDRKSPFSA